MKRARENVPETYAPRKQVQSPGTSSPLTPPPEGRDETGIWDWSKFREGIKSYVLDLKGLGALQTMAATESDGEMDEQEDTPSEEAVARDLEITMKAWEEEYIKSVRISQVMKVKCQQFITDLINSSLSIKESEDGIGTLYTSVIIDSGDLTLDWGELFETEPTKIQALTVSLVYASIFIPAMVVKSYRTFSATNLLKLVHAPVIHVEWTGSINGQKKMYEAECTEGRNTVPGNEGGPSQAKQSRLVDAVDQTKLLCSRDQSNLLKRYFGFFVFMTPKSAQAK
ncbi:unnamed protein product [Parnassius apollo]|uniref:(apollo) hypothetical protein n=1 Tax=Parnassius apollo TaxID=110799 RepID=A0A8S3WJD4_PARAO|nr:unnamed protein product [Parnassius apollo]